MKKGILPTAAALLVCAALLGVPALWARLSDARRLNSVLPRPALSGALDEEARAIPVLYELHNSIPGTLYSDQQKLPEPDPAGLCARAAAVLPPLEEAGVITREELDTLNGLLAEPPTHFAETTGKYTDSIDLMWSSSDNDSPEVIFIVFQQHTDIPIQVSLPVGGDNDAEARLQAWLAMLEIDTLGDWTRLESSMDDYHAVTFYSPKGQASAYCQSVPGSLTLYLVKGRLSE